MIAGCRRKRAYRSAVSGAIASVLLACPSPDGENPLIPTCSVSAISVNPPSSQLEVGGNTTLSASLTLVNCDVQPTVTWESSTPGTATVAGGVVTGVAEGQAVITARARGESGTEQQGFADVTVVPAAVNRIDIAPSPATVEVGSFIQLSATARDARGAALPGRTVTWLALTPAIASVEQSNGLVTGVSVGQGTIRALSEGVTADVLVNVIAGAPSSVTVTLNSSTLSIGQNTQATATVRDVANNVLAGQAVTWSSTAAGVATVNANTGVVTAVAAGQTTIRATVVSAPSVVGGAVLTVQVPVASVTVAPNAATLEPAPSAQTNQQLVATARDAGGAALPGRAISFQSSNPAVASVTANGGLVTANAVGVAQITATSEGVNSAPVVITVTRAFAIVDATQPATASYTPFGVSTAGTITVNRDAVGTYEVVFAGMGTGLIGSSFTALVNAKSGGTNATLVAPAAACNGQNLTVAAQSVTFDVLCSDPATGAAKDAAFRALLIGNNALSGASAFSAHTNTAAVAAYTPLAVFSWNSAGQPMGILPNASTPPGAFGGFQIAHQQGIAFPLQTALTASAFTATLGVACVVQATPLVTESHVVCFNRAGAAINIPHAMMSSTGGRPGSHSGFAFVGGAAGNLQANFSASSAGTINSARTAAGRYTVTFNSMNATGAAAIGVMVSPWGAGAYSHCAHWVISGNPVTIDVACFNAAGAFTDTPGSFTVLVVLP